MEQYTDQHFQQIDFSQQPATKSEYDNCQFTHCNFEATNLSGFVLIDCVFNHCNLSLCKLGNTTFNNCIFSDCKMLGLHFEHCNQQLFTVSFNNCTLNLSSFYQTKIKGVQFNQCSLQEVDFTEANASQANFAHCNLYKAIFENAQLENADFTTAVNFNINPAINKIKNAQFGAGNLAGLLHSFHIQIK
ncbi:MAG: hypothetical protein RIR12_2442 [Bacteroidota bacterium]|jgi:uncharacterized protein YjbI with pentapeptide repeats